MRRRWLIALTLLAVLWISHAADAHFGMVIPSDSMVMQDESREVRVVLSFAHPFEMVGMDMAKPKAFAVLAAGDTQSLLDRLKPVQVMGHEAWQTDFPLRRPGSYIFYMEPEPYWEPAEDLFIIHYTKTVLAAYGDDEGWDAEIGLKTEIIPLTKPFGLYTGNVFQGIVKLNGRPVAWAEVEVEHYNQDQSARAPTAYMITQTIKADQNGVFTYAAPKSGWWGFSALNPADFRLKQNGQDKEVELGAVIWVQFVDWSAQ